MKEIGLYEAKTKFSALVQEVEESGDSIALTRHGKIVAELRPPSKTFPLRGSLQAKDFKMSKDFDQSEIGFEDFFTSESPSLLRASEPKGKYSSTKKK